MKILLSVIFISLNFNFLSAQEKQIITKAEDLPKHSYNLIKRDAVAIVNSKEDILEIAKMLKENLESDLEKYDIRDNSSLKSYYSILRRISILEGDYQKALDYIEMQRALADKESEKIVMGIETIALLKSAMKLNTLDAEKLSESMLSNLEEIMSVDDFTIIQEDIESFKGQTDIYSKNLYLGFAQGELQKAIDNNKGDLPGDLLTSLLSLYYGLNFYIPYKDIYNKAYTTALEKYVVKVEKVNIWEERNIVLENSEKNKPVIIAIWDSGIDTDIFNKDNLLWVNKNEIVDGKDNDGNGFLDDVHGIAYDINSEKDIDYLYSKAHNLPNIKDLQGNMKGITDISANINSDDAVKTKKYLASLKPEEVNNAIEELNLYSNYAHGTHVAGITAEGNPKARLMVSRITFGYKNIPEPLTLELVNQEAKMFREVVAYFKQNKVRVVNMSWGSSYESALSNLEVNGIGENDEARKILAKKYFEISYNAFKEALENAPEILFVCASGNDNNDVDFAANYPSSVNLPNLITVGAVDIEGKKASFTTEGKSVDVYANGYEVMSYVPGGDRIAFSGTSMASPNATNLAGKILSVNPSLTPKEVIDIIVKTATKSTEDENVLLVHPKNAINMAIKN